MSYGHWKSERPSSSVSVYMKGSFDSNTENESSLGSRSFIKLNQWQGSFSNLAIT